MKLNNAKVGSTVRIDSIEESPMKQRLMTMGIIPGTKVEILRSALWGDPIAICLRAYNLALRREDADKIIVTEQ